jgi:hypothetical protein
MSTVRLACLIPGLLAFVGTACAYELGTHAYITDAALDRSVLVQDPERLRSMGFVAGVDAIVGKSYLDLSGGVAHQRHDWPYDYDDNKMLEEQTDAELPTRIRGWLMRGAVREDDSSDLVDALNRKIFRSEPEPLDDPWGNLNRWCNHFFDPYHNRPLTLPTGSAGWAICKSDTYGPAPVWAMGTRGAFSFPQVAAADPARRNHFSIPDAREAMWRALTGYDAAMANRVAGTTETRNAYWATMFRALGDVLHLNQDMAQPQHTRNEDHGAGHAAWFEKYIDGRAKGHQEVRYDFRIGVLQARNLVPLLYPAYPVPRFDSYAAYWSTGTGAATMDGMGMADYSSRGFLTPAKGIGNAEYPSPSPDARDYEARSLDVDGASYEEYLYAAVRDSYTGSASEPIRMVRRSLWDDALDSPEALPRGPLYTFDTATYDDRAALLIPRATAYSAGILDYFFRGRMEISAPGTGFYGIVDVAVLNAAGESTDAKFGWKGFPTLKLRLANATPAIDGPGGPPLAQAMTRGTLVAVLRFHRNLCYASDLSSWPTSTAAAGACRWDVEEIATSDPLPDQAVPFADDGPREYAFTFSRGELPINAWDVKLQVVYRGVLGSEADAVVVAARDLSEPTFATYVNATDYVVIDGAFYTPAAVAAQQPLFDRVLPICREGEPGAYRVNAWCYNRTDDFTFTAGTSSVTLSAAGATSVRPRGLVRIALLAEPETPVAFGWQTGAVSCWKFLGNPLLVTPYVAQVDDQGGLLYALPSTLRSVKVWDGALCYADIGVEETEPAMLHYEQLDDLTSDEQIPTPITISGWD